MSLLSLECALKCCWRSASCACKLPENYFLQANCARSILVKLRSRSVILQLILEMAEKYKKVNCRMSQVFEPNFLLGLELLVVSIIVITNRRMSFVVKYEWKGILSVFFCPIGLFDPLWCRISMCIIVTVAIANCIMKCYAKNRGRVAMSTANRLHTHWIISFSYVWDCL